MRQTTPEPTDAPTAFHRSAAQDQETGAQSLQSDLLALTVHELRQPLTSISGFVRLLLQGPDPVSPQQRRWLEILERSNDHLRGLVDDLLTLSKAGSGHLAVEPEQVEVRELVEAVAETFAPTWDRRGLRFRAEVPAGLPPAHADRRRTEQILVNLLGNAAKFTPEGGEVRVAATAGEHGLELRISDTGPGIHEDDLPRIFEPFFRSGSYEVRSRQGSGLGLAIAQSFAEAQGGTLVAESVPGRGATFVLALPAAPAGRARNAEDALVLIEGDRTRRAS